MVKIKEYGKCLECGSRLSKNDFGISIKFYGEKGQKLCISCMAEQLSVTTEDILDKIEEYKNEGCILFQ